MASSDDEYVQDISSPEASAPRRPANGGTKSRAPDGPSSRTGAFNLDVDRTWENLPTDEAGELRIEALQAKQRKR